jgi:hypothetical protein
MDVNTKKRARDYQHFQVTLFLLVFPSFFLTCFANLDLGLISRSGKASCMSMHALGHVTAFVRFFQFFFLLKTKNLLQIARLSPHDG